MARIFISYARKYEPFARQLATSLSNLGADVWIDVEDIPAGMKWSSAIQQGLDLCDVMLVIIAPESMASVNVEDEWQYYLDNKKPVIPILYVPAKVHFQLSRIQYVDFHRQDYDTALRQLYSELRHKGAALNPLPNGNTSAQIPDQQPLPVIEDAEVTTPLFDKATRRGRSSSRAIIIGAVITGLIAVLAAVVPPLLNRTGAPTDTPANTDTPSVTLSTQAVVVPTQAPSATFTPSETPDFNALALTYDANSTQTQAPLQTATANAKTAEANRSTATNSAAQTATAISWTATPTPNIMASFEAFLTQSANSTATQLIINATATATLWTATPTPTLTVTPSHTPTSTATPSPTLTNTPSPTFIPSPTALGGGNGQIAFRSNMNGNGEIYVINSDGSNIINITRYIADEASPAWSPDGRKISFMVNHGTNQIYIMNVNGSNAINLSPDATNDSDPTFSPDGTKIAFQTSRDGNYEIYVMNTDGSTPVNLTYSQSTDASPAWSPDGTKIAFVSDRDGNNEIYVNHEFAYTSPPGPLSIAWRGGERSTFKPLHSVERGLG
jgi:hypothetical protein